MGDYLPQIGHHGICEAAMSDPTGSPVAAAVQQSAYPGEPDNVIEGRFPEPPPDSYDVFVSYCKEDMSYWKEIEIHLKPIRRKGVKIYSYDLVEPGAVIRNEVRSALKTAVVAILLISKYYLASDLMERELLALLKQAERGTRILRLQAGTCDLSDWDTLTKYQQVGAGNPPLNRLREPNRDDIYVELLSAIKKRLIECGRYTPSVAGTQEGT